MTDPQFVSWRPFKELDRLEPVDGYLLHWFDPSDPFANRMSLTVAPSDDDFIGTVIFAGLPIMVMIAGSANYRMGDNGPEDYDHHFIRYHSKTLNTMVMAFWALIGEVDEDAVQRWTDEADDDTDPMDWLDAGDGRETAMFVSRVATWMYAGVKELGVILPVSPEAVGL